MFLVLFFLAKMTGTLNILGGNKAMLMPEALIVRIFVTSCPSKRRANSCQSRRRAPRPSGGSGSCRLSVLRLSEFFRPCGSAPPITAYPALLSYHSIYKIPFILQKTLVLQSKYSIKKPPPSPGFINFVTGHFQQKSSIGYFLPGGPLVFVPGPSLSFHSGPTML